MRRIQNLGLLMPCNCRHGVGPHDHLGESSLRSSGLGPVDVPLNNFIDLQKVQVWNCKQSAHEAAAIVDPNTRGDGGGDFFVESDADQELLMHIPLTEFVRLRGVCIRGPVSCSSSPAHVKLYANCRDVSGFDSIRRARSDQELLLAANISSDDEIIYRLDGLRFSNVSTLVLFFDENFGAETTQVMRIELIGMSTRQPVNRPLATNVVYESMANPADHRAAADDRTFQSLVQ